MEFTAATPRFADIPRPAFGRAAQHLPANPSPKKAKAEARYVRAAKTAAALLPDLPQPGESVHALMTGRFDLCQVITSVVARLPACRHLRIATLCLSRRNAADLLGLAESRPAMRLTLLTSAFFRGHNKALFEWLAGELADRPNARLAAARSHCKVVCFDLGPGDGVVFEGSANLRTNGNREQLAVIRDWSLHQWHCSWIDELVNADGEEEAGG